MAGFYTALGSISFGCHNQRPSTPCGDDQSLACDMPRQRVGGKKHGGMSHVVGVADLRQGHRGRYLSSDGGIAQLGGGTRYLSNGLGKCN